MDSTPIVNRVSGSSLVTFDLENFYPSQEIIELDIKPWLFQGLMLKEKEFRASLKAHDWSLYRGKLVCTYCSVDAIIPQWTYVLLASYLYSETALYCQGSKNDLVLKYYQQAFNEHDFEQYEGAKVVLKGCGDKPVPEAIYMEAASRLLPRVSSLMFGEPCSTVPIFKKRKT